MTEPFILIFNTTSNLAILPSPFSTENATAQDVRSVTCQKCLQASFGRVVSIRPSVADATTVCKNVTKSLTLLPPHGLDDQMPGR